MTDKAYLKRISNNNSMKIPKVIPLTSQTKLGRNSNKVDVYINSTRVPLMISREHAVIERIDDVWQIKDNKSLNGLFVNDKKISMSILKSGDVIVLGGGGDLPEGAIKSQPHSEFIFSFHLGTPKRDLEDNDQSQWDTRSQKRSKPCDEEAEKLKLLLHQKEQELEQIEESKRELEMLREKEIESIKALEDKLNRIEKEKSDERVSYFAEIEKLNQLIQKKDISMINHQELLEELVCSICQELIVTPLTLPCAHSFCETCITTWMKQKRICPVCRVVPTSPALRSLHLDSILDKLANKLDDSEKQSYLTRKSEREQIDKLKKGIAFAKESGFKFLCITEVWSVHEQKTFADGVSKYFGEARKLYCSAAGLTDTFLRVATHDMLLAASKNIGLNYPPWTLSSTLQQLLQAFLNK